MTKVQKLRRAVRRRARKAGTVQTPRRARTAQQNPKARRRMLQTIVCAAVFVALIALKLLVPGNLAVFRASLDSWLVRDADFVAAFHAIGEAVGGEEELGESLSAAYTAVFGDTENAVEVLGAENIAVQQEILGFDCVSPLNGTLTSGFGSREDPNTGKEATHCGVDIAAAEGTDILAFADGTVSIVGDSTVLGKYLTVQHENGYETLYAHCSAIAVRSGESVSAGDKIAAVGQTGNATGPHLHFELHRDDTFLNPVYYLDLQE